MEITTQYSIRRTGSIGVVCLDGWESKHSCNPASMDGITTRYHTQSDSVDTGRIHGMSFAPGDCFGGILLGNTVSCSTQVRILHIFDLNPRQVHIDLGNWHVNDYEMKMDLNRIISVFMW